MDRFPSARINLPSYCMFQTRKNILLCLAFCLLVIASLFAYFYFAGTPAKKPVDVVQHPTHPISYVKEEYIRCTTEEKTDKAKGDCLNALAQATYGFFPNNEITAQLDSLSYEQKDRWCHETLHYMGWRAFIVEKDIAKAFLNSSDICDSGMYHGIVEEYLREQGLQGNMEDLVKHVCVDSLATFPNLTKGTLGLCHHGLGHGLMYITTADLQKSLDYCDLLDREYTNACYGGVFMEYTASKAVGPLAGNERQDIKDFSYCNDLRDSQKSACLRRQGSNNFIAAGGKVGDAMRMCLSIPGEENQYSCFGGVGTNNPAPSRKNSDAAKSCTEALEVSATSYSACVNESVGFILQMDHGATKGVVEFCDASPEENKDECYRSVGSELAPWTSSEDERKMKCLELQEGTAQQSCVKGHSPEN